MSEPDTDQARVLAQARSAAQSALFAEIETVVLARLEAAGGNIGQLARFKSALGSALGVIGTVKDIRDMAMAGFEAMTIRRRMLLRVSTAHGFGYWAFQHMNIQSPLNPPNSFLIMHRASDRRDRHIAQVTDNATFSSDSGLTAGDWNSVWRRGVQSSVGGMQSRMMHLALRGRLQPILEERLGPNVDVHRQRREAIVNQYRIVILCPELGTPAAAAGSFFLSSLAGVRDDERDMNLRLYRQFPYNPTVLR